MRANSWTNADGLYIGYGARDTVNVEAGSIHTKGRVRQLEVEIYATEGGDGTTTAKDSRIPLGAVVTGATLYVSEAFADGTSVSVGTTQDGGANTADPDSLVAATLTAALTEGAVVAGAGDLIDAMVETYPVVVTTTVTGAFTAGHATVVIEYIQPSASA